METISVRNPATGEEILKTVSVDPAQVDALVATARRSQENSWGRLSFQERGRFILRAKDFLFENIDAIAAAISKNNGKPLVESLTAEVIPMIQTIDFAVRNAQKILRPQKIKIGAQLPTKRAYVHYAPLGVVGIISPWNYPLSTPLAEVILGLMAGNAIILKPSEVTGLVNRQIQNIVDSMRLPPGIFQMIEGRGDVGAALARAAVDRIIVTGSVATGKRVMAAAADRLTPVTLELGGKDSMIVLDDADIDKASSAAVVGGFYNAGQTCCSVEKILVHEKIATPFLAALNKKLATLRTGESKDFKNDLGPVTFEGQKKTYHAQTKDFQSHHGRVLFGEPSYDGQAAFMNPLVVEADRERDFWKEETFGPVVAVRTFKTDAEAIALNNDSQFGLSALVWSGSTARAKKIAEELHVGTVVINDAPFTNAVCTLPWGGQRDSGFGRVHGEWGLKELSHMRLVAYDIAGQQKQPWWYPYSQAQYDFFKAYAVLFSANGLMRKLGALPRLLKAALRMGPRL